MVMANNKRMRNQLSGTVDGFSGIAPVCFGWMEFNITVGNQYIAILDFQRLIVDIGGIGK